MSRLTPEDYVASFNSASSGEVAPNPKDEFKRSLLEALSAEETVSGLRPNIDTSKFNMDNVRANVVEGVRRDSRVTGISLTPEEQILASMSPLELAQRYPDLAARYAQARTGAINDIHTTRTLERSGAEVAVDGVAGLLGTLVGGVAQLGAMGVAAQGKGIEALTGGEYGSSITDAGVELSNTISDLHTSWNNATQSETLRRKRALKQTIADVYAADSEIRYQQAIENGESPLIGRLSQVGQQAMFDAADIMDDKALFMQEVVESLGSFGIARAASLPGQVARNVGARYMLKEAGEEIAEGLSARAALKAAAVRDIAANKTSGITKLNKRYEMFEKAEWPLGLGAMMGSSAFEQTNAEVKNMTHAELMRKSPPYKELFHEFLSEGMSVEDAAARAKVRVAGNSALLAAAVSGTIAMPTALISKVGSKEWLNSGTGKLKDFLASTIVKEPIANLIQEGGGAYGRNLGIQQFADESRELGEGVAVAASSGAFVGAGMAGTLGSTKVLSATKDATKVVAGGIAAGAAKGSKALAERKLRKQDSGDITTPTGQAEVQTVANSSAKDIREQFSTINTEALYEEGLAEFNENQKKHGKPEMTAAQRVEHTGKILDLVLDSADVSTIDMSTYSEGVKKIVGKHKDVVSATSAVIDNFHSSKDRAAQKENIKALIDLTQSVTNSVEAFNLLKDSPQFKALPEASRKVLSDLATANNNFRESSKYLEMQENPLVGELYAEIMREAGEGASHAQVISAAIHHPGSATLQQMEKTLKATDSPVVASILKMQIGVMKAVEAAAKTRSNSGDMVRVTQELLTAGLEGSSPDAPASLVSLLQEITGSLVKGDSGKAAASLEHLGMLAQHMLNKKASLEHSKQNNGLEVPYYQLIPGKLTWGLSTDKENTSKFKTLKYAATPKGLSFYESVNREADTLVEAFNAAAEMLKELGVEKVTTPMTTFESAEGTGDAGTGETGGEGTGETGGEGTGTGEVKPSGITIDAAKKRRDYSKPMRQALNKLSARANKSIIVPGRRDSNKGTTLGQDLAQAWKGVPTGNFTAKDVVLIYVDPINPTFNKGTNDLIKAAIDSGATILTLGHGGTMAEPLGDRNNPRYKEGLGKVITQLQQTHTETFEGSGEWVRGTEEASPSVTREAKLESVKEKATEAIKRYPAEGLENLVVEVAELLEGVELTGPELTDLVNLRFLHEAPLSEELVTAFDPLFKVLYEHGKKALIEADNTPSIVKLAKGEMTEAEFLSKGPSILKLGAISHLFTAKDTPNLFNAYMRGGHLTSLEANFPEVYAAIKNGKEGLEVLEVMLNSKNMPLYIKDSLQTTLALYKASGIPVPPMEFVGKYLTKAGTPGTYFHNHRIALTERGSSPLTIIHELNHGLTVKGIESWETTATNEYVDTALSLGNFILDKIRKNSESFKRENGTYGSTRYGATNLYELSAEITNPFFVEALESIKVSEAELKAIDPKGDVAKFVELYGKKEVSLYELTRAFLVRALAWITNTEIANEGTFYSLAQLQSIYVNEAIIATAKTYGKDVSAEALANTTHVSETHKAIIERLKEKKEVSSDSSDKFFKNLFSNKAQGSLRDLASFVSSAAAKRAVDNYNRVLENPETTAEELYNLEMELIAARSRLAGESNPIQVLEAVIESASPEDFKAILGDSIHANRRYNRQEIRTGFRPVISLAKDIASRMNSKFEEFMDNQGTSLIENNLEGKFLVFTETNAEGNTVLNQAVVEAYSLALAQWVVNDSSTKRELYKEELEQLTGLSSFEVPWDVKNALNENARESEVVHAIARRAQQYLGLITKETANKGDVSGAFGTLAVHGLEALEDLGVGYYSTVSLPTDSGTLYFHGYGVTESGKALRKGTTKFPDLLDVLAVGESEHTRYVGEFLVPKAGTRQLGNRYSKLSKEQRKAINNSNKIEFFANLEFFSLVEELGVEGFAELKGIDLNPIGDVQKDKVKGQLQSLKTAWEESQVLLDLIKEEAKDSGAHLTRVPVRFAGDITRVLRMQLRGRVTPQSSTLMRHLFLPTKATINMADAKAREALYTSLAQGVFDEKIGRKSGEHWEKTIKPLMALPEMKAILSHLGSSRGNPKEYVAKFHSLVDTFNANNKFNIEKTELSIFSLMEYAKNEDRILKNKPITTSLYIEQDGINNGILNAVMAMASKVGDFDSFMRVINAGGVTLAEYATASELYERTGTDIYGMGANEFTKNYKEFLRVVKLDLLASPKEVVDSAADAVHFLLDNFLNGFTALDDGSIELGRNAVKYRFMERIYGSGLDSSSKGDLADALDSLYTRIESAKKYALKHKVPLHPSHLWHDMLTESNVAELTQRTNKLLAHLNTLVNVGFTVEGVSYKREKPVNFTFHSLMDNSFQLTESQFNYAARNVRTFYSQGVRNAIDSVLGESVTSSMDLLQTVTNTRSNLFAEVLKMKIEKFIKDEGRARHRYISTKELDSLIGEIQEYFPEMTIDGRQFLVTKFAELSLHPQDSKVIKAGTPLITASTAMSTSSKGKDGKARRKTNIQLEEKFFSSVGVGAMANVNIGLGDAKMIENMLAQAMPGILHVFDGINLPLHEAANYGTRINKAQLDAWLTNPMKAISDMANANTFLVEVLADLYKDFFNVDGVPLKDTETIPWYDFKTEADFLRMPQAASDLVRLVPRDEKFTIDSLRTLVTNAMLLADEKVLEREATVRTFKKMGISSDQMSAMNTPHLLEGTVKVKDGQLLSEVFERTYAEELSNLIADPSERTELTSLSNFQRTLAPGLERGRKLVTVSGKRGIDKLIAASTLDASARKLLTKVLGNDPDVSVVIGSPIELSNFLRSKGVHNIPASEAREGKYLLTDTGEAYILLGNQATSETIGAELLHHASFRNTYDIVNRASDKKAPVHYAATYRNMNAIYNEISNLFRTPKKNFTDAQNEAIANLKAEIDSITKGAKLKDLNALNQAKVFDEIFSWTQANPELRRVTQGTSLRARAAKSLANLLNRISKLFGMVLGSPSMSLLDSIQFTYKVVATTPVNPNTVFTEDISLNHRKTAKGSNREKVQNAVNKVAGEITVSPELAAEIEQAASDAVNNFSLAPEVAQLFKNLYGILSTPGAFRNVQLSQINKLRADFFKNVSPEDFVAAGLDANTYIALANTAGTPTSRAASFVALAHSSEQFSDLLSKINTRSNISATDIDTTIASWTTSALDAVTDVIFQTDSTQGNRLIDTAIESGLRQNPNTVQSINSVSESVIDTLEDKFKTSVRNLLDGEKIQSSKLAGKDSLIGDLVFTAGKLLTSIQEGRLSDRVLVTLSRARMDVTNPIAKEFLDVFASLAREFTGRTLDNAEIYDMIKKVSFAVDSTKKKYKEIFPDILRAKFESITEAEERALNKLSQDSGIAGIVKSLGTEQTVQHILDTSYANNTLGNLEKRLLTITGDPNVVKYMTGKVKQLVNFNLTSDPGHNLLQNAAAIANGLNSGLKHNFRQNAEAAAEVLEDMIAVQSALSVPSEVRETFRELYKRERKAVDFLLNQLEVIQLDESAKEGSSLTKYNEAFGYMPTESLLGRDVIVAKTSKEADLRSLGYTKGETINDGLGYAYYYTNFNPTATFGKGIIQIVNKSVNGVEVESGASLNPFRHSITDPSEVLAVRNRYFKDPAKYQGLIPLYNAAGQIYGFDRVLPKNHRDYLTKETSVFSSMGIWQSRQIEEGFSDQVNQELANKVADVWKKNELTSTEDARFGEGRRKTRAAATFVNINDPSQLTVIERDAIKLIPKAAMRMLTEAFEGGPIMIRKDMLMDIVGRREASVSDIFTGNTDMNKELRIGLNNAFTAVFGRDASKKLLQAETVVRGSVDYARHTIVIASVVVPAINMLSSFVQLGYNGISPISAGTAYPRKLKEVETYVGNMRRRIEVEAGIRILAENDPERARLQAELTAIDDTNKSLSVWPLIEAGELNTIADLGMDNADGNILNGRAGEWLSDRIKDLPPAAQTLVKQGLVTRDTAFYKGMEKVTLYGDFIAKAILHDKLMKDGMSHTEAMAYISEEFIHYDRLAGRTRNALENLGLLWFWNFKLRAVKPTIRAITRHPLRSLMFANMPMPFGITTAMQDNIVTRLLTDRHSGIGPGMVLQAITANPYAALISSI